MSKPIYLLKSNVPLTKWDAAKMKLINKDSAEVKFTNEYDEQKQELKFIFNKEPLEKYNLNANKEVSFVILFTINFYSPITLTNTLFLRRPSNSP